MNTHHVPAQPEIVLILPNQSAHAFPRFPGCFSPWVGCWGGPRGKGELGSLGLMLLVLCCPTHCYNAQPQTATSFSGLKHHICIMSYLIVLHSKVWMCFSWFSTSALKRLKARFCLSWIFIWMLLGGICYQIYSECWQNPIPCNVGLKFLIFWLTVGGHR